MQSMKDAPLVDCPQCQTKSLKRLLGTGSGIIFKGSGFYETDYKKKAADKPTGETAVTEKKESTGTATQSAPPPAANSSCDSASSNKATGNAA